ncbi:PE family protein [Mycobacterium sp. E1386]|uniref:PPE family protein, SVP subgroup n=1 Tax=unclassified Mycobacterium TaxID=2642494 RepID=UPI0008002340|nr:MULTISPECIES: PE domain-containing protein [unclassified Mycobacterium]OBI27742.1 PE family protein [Mycobacterium sp. E1386]OBI29950.1 PE family protein [Mycobacterium sp. E2238]
MAFLTTQTEEMLAAEALLSGINTNLAAQNAGAAPATTAIIPAGADPVSAQQAAIFTAYGTQYQAIASEAQTLLEQYAQTLGISSGSYTNTEAVNAAQSGIQALDSINPSASAGTTGSNPLDVLQWLLGGTGNYSGGLGGPFSLSGNGANIGNIGFGNWASAGSDLLGLAGGGLLDTSAADAAGSAADAAGLADSTAPMAGGMGMGGVGALPAAGLGQATMVGKLSVPPTWAGPATPLVGTSAAPLQTVGWTAAAPQAGTGTIIPGMPGMGAAARNSAGFGAPRYGVKPIVMPKPATV